MDISLWSLSAEAVGFILKYMYSTSNYNMTDNNSSTKEQ